MSLISKQVSSKNGSFYVLQNPSVDGALYHIGELLLEGNMVGERLGFFTTYDQSSEQSLGPNTAVLKADELKRYLEKGASSGELRLNPSFEGHEEYRELFSDIQAEMEIGELKKAVLFQSVQAAEAEFPSKSEFFSYVQTILSNQEGGFLFGFYNPVARQAYLGVTPEFLCREFENVKYTTAVAGTKTESDESNEWDEKLKEEHALVKQGVDQTYKVDWSESVVHKFGPLRHLKSEGVLKTEDSVGDVSRSLHPTSAVGTLPRELSLSFKMGDLSSKDRGHFGGYALLESVANPFSLVTIRGLEWSNENAFVCIGGGVLPQSQFGDEWVELEKKWEAFRGLWKK